MYCLCICWCQVLYTCAKLWAPAAFLRTLGALVSVSKHLGLTLFLWFPWFCPPPFRWGLCISISTMGCCDPSHTWGWTWGGCSCNIWNWTQLPDFPIFNPPAGPTCLRSCCPPGTFWWHYKLLTLISTDIQWWNPSNIKKSIFTLWNTAVSALWQDNNDKVMDKSH